MKGERGIKDRSRIHAVVMTFLRNACVSRMDGESNGRVYIRFDTLNTVEGVEVCAVVELLYNFFLLLY